MTKCEELTCRKEATWHVTNDANTTKNHVDAHHWCDEHAEKKGLVIYRKGEKEADKKAGRD